MGSANMLLALAVIIASQPRITQRPKSQKPRVHKPSGNMPDGASKMLALPKNCNELSLRRFPDRFARCNDH
jgi:hypothetical protein